MGPSSQGDSNRELWHHPYSIHVFGMVIGFALVMRVQIAYARFWEGATNLRMMSSKMGDAVRPPPPHQVGACCLRMLPAHGACACCLREWWCVVKPLRPLAIVRLPSPIDHANHHVR